MEAHLFGVCRIEFVSAWEGGHFWIVDWEDWRLVGGWSDSAELPLQSFMSAVGVEHIIVGDLVL